MVMRPPDPFALLNNEDTQVAGKILLPRVVAHGRTTGEVEKMQGEL